MPSLRELQTQVLRAVLGGDDGPASQLVVARGIPAARRLGIYANNARVNFLESLRTSFPAVLRLVGEDYFHQCVRGYQGRHPSVCGDLQYTGGRFADYLSELHADDEFRYLGDVARLEWARQESLIGADHPPLDLAKLAAVAPSEYAELRFALHPACRLFESQYPCWRIWEQNVASDGEPETIDLSSGGDRLLFTRNIVKLEVHHLSRGEFCFLTGVRDGERFGQAVELGLMADEGFDAAAALRKFVLAGAIVDGK
jgi:hypothetical protein